jgi:hypothetical protein
MKRQLLTTMIDTLRDGTARAARRLAKKNGSAGLGHNGGPPLED